MPNLQKHKVARTCVSMYISKYSVTYNIYIYIVHSVYSSYSMSLSSGYADAGRLLAFVPCSTHLLICIFTFSAARSWHCAYKNKQQSVAFPTDPPRFSAAWCEWLQLCRIKGKFCLFSLLALLLPLPLVKARWIAMFIHRLTAATTETNNNNNLKSNICQFCAWNIPNSRRFHSSKTMSYSYF